MAVLGRHPDAGRCRPGTGRIRAELDKLRGQADFPVEFLPTAAVEKPEQLKSAADVATADVLLIYAAGGGQELLNAANDLGKPIVFFLREKSGPLSFYYEAISPWYFRHNTDQLATKSADYNDVVVDVPGRADLAAAGPVRPEEHARHADRGDRPGRRLARPKAPELAKERFQTGNPGREVSRAGRADQGRAAGRSGRRPRSLSGAEAYLKLPGTTLETDRQFVDNAFLLDQIFRRLMQKADCRAIDDREPA